MEIVVPLSNFLAGSLEKVSLSNYFSNSRNNIFMGNCLVKSVRKLLEVALKHEKTKISVRVGTVDRMRNLK